MKISVLSRSKIHTVILLWLALLLSVPLSGNLAMAESPTTLRVALYPYVPDRRELFYELEAAFESEHPGVNLELVESSDLTSDYYSGGIQKVYADVYEIDTILLSDMIQIGKIAPLAPPNLDFTTEAIEAVTRHNQTYGVPHWLCGNFLFYRKGDTEIENAASWTALNKVFSRRGTPLFVDFKGSSTLGEWYLTMLTGLYGLNVAQHTVMQSSVLDKSVVSQLTAILKGCPSGFCRNDDLHNRVGFYARAFMTGSSSAYVGYSETIHFGLQNNLHNCLPTSGCLKESDVAIRKLPAIQSAGQAEGLGWVDALTIDAQLSGRKKALAIEFIEFAVSERAYRMVLEPEWGKAPRYLIPAYKISNIKSAPLYDQFYIAHAGRKTGILLGLNNQLRELGEKLDCALPFDRADEKTIKECQGN